MHVPARLLSVTVSHRIAVFEIRVGRLGSAAPKVGIHNPLNVCYFSFLTVRRERWSGIPISHLQHYSAYHLSSYCMLPFFHSVSRPRRMRRACNGSSAGSGGEHISLSLFFPHPIILSLIVRPTNIEIASQNETCALLHLPPFQRIAHQSRSSQRRSARRSALVVVDPRMIRMTRQRFVRKKCDRLNIICVSNVCIIF